MTEYKLGGISFFIKDAPQSAQGTSAKGNLPAADEEFENRTSKLEQMVNYCDLHAALDILNHAF